MANYPVRYRERQLITAGLLRAEQEARIDAWRVQAPTTYNARIDLPVGDSDKLTGNDDLDYSLWLAGSSRLGTLSLLDANIGVVMPGDSVLPGLPAEDLVIFGHAGMHIAINQVFALKLQLAGHTAYYQDTSLDFLDNALIIIFGSSINTGR